MEKKTKKLKTITLEDLKKAIISIESGADAGSVEEQALSSKAEKKWTKFEKKTLKKMDKEIIKGVKKRDKKVSKGKTEDIGAPEIIDEFGI